MAPRPPRSRTDPPPPAGPDTPNRLNRASAAEPVRGACRAGRLSQDLAETAQAFRAQFGDEAFLSEMTVVTALRTAATSAMVAKRLARPDSRHMAMMGTGKQTEFQALAFRRVLGPNHHF
ncbi:hypothetical protein ACQCSX_06730 [Pseudarthrobacter sp. P1]|uniref:hypothetical protein n=1 Tax=Pseudarthrobacter sp. P1 TaxID=3418418 RepID=UPI003CF5CF30